MTRWSPFFSNLFVLLDRLKGTLVPIDESHHLTANSYANAWFINAAEIPSETDVYVSFKPQVPFVLGLIVSVTTIVSLSVLLFVAFLKKYVFRN